MGDALVVQLGETAVTYDDFLMALFHAPHSIACSMMERLAGCYGKSVRDVSADFKAKFGTHL